MLFFGKKPKGERIVIGPMRLSVADRKTRAQSRNVARMERIQQVLAELPEGSPERESFEKEFHIRRLKAEISKAGG